MRAVAIALALACSATAGTLTLDHDDLAARITRALRGATLLYTEDRVVVRTRVKRAGFWWPVRAEAVFVRVAGRVRLAVTQLLVRGRVDAAHAAMADDMLSHLVDAGGDVERVVIVRDGAAVFSQDVTARAPHSEPDTIASEESGPATRPPRKTVRAAIMPDRPAWVHSGAPPALYPVGGAP